MTEITESKSPATTPEHRRAFSARQARAGAQGLINRILMILTVRDIRKRGDDELKGNRKLWLLAAFAPPLGPIAYLIFGRNRGTQTIEVPQTITE
ncbi:MAG: PLDc_N domain-containing protein [Chloroflexi bacterium]|nr:PLDc_N domain-containing protein [Chloroflexota bacterium]